MRSRFLTKYKIKVGRFGPEQEISRSEYKQRIVLLDLCAKPFRVGTRIEDGAPVKILTDLEEIQCPNSEDSSLKRLEKKFAPAQA